MTNYKTILDNAFNELGRKSAQRKDLEIECAKLRQFILATMNMLPDEEREAFHAKLLEFWQEEDIKTASLTDAIRVVLRENPKQWYSASQMRDRLMRGGFNFSEYSSNPLASVATTLKRMKPEDGVETAVVEGVAAYRWKRRPIAHSPVRTRGMRLETAMQLYAGTTSDESKKFGKGPVGEDT